ncbi:MAG TPA: MarR family transcriptional regulator [Gemmatimonadales bacterium]|nr:MarR family transcriptional regulator [Gemmatimonadales bacterium]
MTTELATVDFVERLGRMLESDGYPRIAGRLFGALLLASEEASLDDLASALDVSKASVSINARLLEERGIVERVSHPGDRRDFYRVTPDLFRRSMERRIERWRAFHEAITAVRPAISRRETEVVRRLDDLDAAYSHVLGAVSDALDRWSARPAERRKSGAVSSRGGSA